MMKSRYLFAMLLLLGLAGSTPAQKLIPWTQSRYQITEVFAEEIFGMPQGVTPNPGFKFDASKNLDVNCIVGCSAAATFADNAAFTAGTTAINITGGWFSAAPTACTNGSACAPSLTSDRKLFVQAFQGTSPWVVSLTSTTITGTVGVTQSTSPWVVSVPTWAGGTLGAMANYGTSPGAVLVPGVNAFVTNTVPVTLTSTTITGTVAENLTQVAGTTLGATAVTNFGTAPAAAAVPGVNASMFTGLTAAAAATFGTTNAGNGFLANASIFSGTTALGAPNTFGTTAPTGNALGVNASLFIGTTLAANAGAGVQKVGIVGNAGAAFDAANNSAAPSNIIIPGVQINTVTTDVTSGTTGFVQRMNGDLQGNLFVRQGSPHPFSCFVEAVTVTTQCQAAPAAGLRAYVTSIDMSNEAATAQSLDIVFGTGANCATGTTALTHKHQFGTVATTTSPLSITATYLTPLVPTAANAICVRPSAATAFGATVTGFIAP
jgi:hypothetical protein